jgi:hypothetical protein
MPKESDFHRELAKDLKEDGVTLKKIPDAPVSYTQKDDGSKVRFSPPKFVDLVGVGPREQVTSSHALMTPFGRPLFLECKMMTKLNSFPLKRIEPNQLRDLLEVSDRASALFVINYRVKKYAESTIKKLDLEAMIDHKRINALTVVMPHDILSAIEAGLKSLPIAELSKAFVSRPWGGRWTYEGE